MNSSNSFASRLGRWLAPGLIPLLFAAGAHAQDEVKPPSGRLFFNLAPGAGAKLGGFGEVDPRAGTWKKVSDELAMAGRVSPDARRVAYVRRRSSEEISICVREIARAEPPKVLAQGNGTFAWAPDSQELIVSMPQKGGGLRFETFRMPVDGQNGVTLPLSETDFIQDWSADGRWLAMIHLREAREILVRPDGRSRKPLDKPVPQTKLRLLRFRPDRKTVLAGQVRKTGPSSEGYDLVLVDLESGDRKVLVEGKPDSYPVTACWSPDGSWVAYSQAEPGGPSSRNPEAHLEVIRADGTQRRRVVLPASILSVLDWR